MDNYDFSPFNSVVLKEDLVFGNKYDSVFCTKEIEELSRSRKILIVDSVNGSYIDMKNSDSIYSEKMLNRIEFKEGMILKFKSHLSLDELYHDEDGKHVALGSGLYDGDIATITYTYSDGTFDINLDQGRNFWCASNFDRILYDPGDFEKGDIVKLKDNLKYNEYLYGNMIDDRLEDIKDIFFEVLGIYNTGVLRIEAIGETIDIDDDDIAFGYLFDKVDVKRETITNIIEPEDTFVKLKDNILNPKYIFTDEYNSYIEKYELDKVKQLNKDEIYKIIRFDFENDEFLLAKTDDVNYGEVIGIFPMIFFNTFSQKIKDILDTGSFEEGMKVQLKDSLELGEFYQDYNCDTLCFSSYFKDLINKKFKVIRIEKQSGKDLKIAIVKMYLFDDNTVALPEFKIPLCFLKRVKEIEEIGEIGEIEAVKLSVPTLKPGNKAKFKQNLDTDKYYYSIYGEEPIRCLDCYCNNTLTLGVITSDVDTTVVRFGTDLNDITDVPTMFLNLYVDRHNAMDLTITENEKVEENKNMKRERGNVIMKNLGLGNAINKMFGEVGIVDDGSLSLTLTGKVAIKRKDGDFVRWDEEKEVMENQGDLIFPGSEKLMMLMPSPTVEVGDIIKNNGKYYQVSEKKDNGSLKTVNFETGHATTILKETNLFNMNFYTKVTSLMTGFGGDNSAMNPMMMLLLSKDEEGKDIDITSLMMVSTLFGGQQQMNPMMMMLMLKDSDGEGKSDLMQTMMMASMFNGSNSNPFTNMFGQQQPQCKTEDIVEKKVNDEQVELIETQIRLIETQSRSLEVANDKIEKLTALVSKLDAPTPSPKVKSTKSVK